MKTADIWGACPYRISKYMVNGESLYGTWAGYVYFCDKIGGLCDPNYCLGPDEDKLTEEKGGTDED